MIVDGLGGPKKDTCETPWYLELTEFLSIKPLRIPYFERNIKI